MPLIVPLYVAEGRTRKGALRVIPAGLRAVCDAKRTKIEIWKPMAIFHLSVQPPISRASGRSVTAAAAYRAGEKIADARTGEVHDYKRKAGILYANLMLPGGGSENRSVFWNRLEMHHKRGDAILAREVIIALPDELNEADRQEVAKKFAQHLADRYGVAADLAIHAPSRKPGADERNFHAHILLSACQCDETGMLKKKPSNWIRSIVGGQKY